MPPHLLFDITKIDLERVLFGKHEIRQAIPHRGQIEQLDGVTYAELESPQPGVIGFKDVRHDEFWVEGHVPGRPIMPGVLMLEAAAQLASFYLKIYEKWDGFVGFGGVDDVRFRQQVLPGQRLYILQRKIKAVHGRYICRSQGLVNGNLAFEAQIIGVKMG